MPIKLSSNAWQKMFHSHNYAQRTRFTLLFLFLCTCTKSLKVPLPLRVVDPKDPSSKGQGNGGRPSIPRSDEIENQYELFSVARA